MRLAKEKRKIENSHLDLPEKTNKQQQQNKKNTTMHVLSYWGNLWV